MMIVQFLDKTEEEIISYFSYPLGLEDFPNIGSVEETDPRWAVFYKKVHMWLDGLPEPVISKNKI